MISFATFFESFKNKTLHPHKDEKGRDVVIRNPSMPSPREDWHRSDKARVFPVGHPVPEHLNGIPLTDHEIQRPTPNHGLDSLSYGAKPGLKKAAGILVVEPDKSVWVTEPTNHFGYRRTFPKGTLDDGEHMQTGAMREVHEETGLHTQIVAHLGDYERTTSKCRYYIGKRIGGSPANMGWESQAMHLVHIDQLEDYMHDPMDKQIARDLKARLKRS